MNIYITKCLLSWVVMRTFGSQFLKYFKQDYHCGRLFT